MAQKSSFTLDQSSYLLPSEEVARLLETNIDQGLSKQEAKRRHEIVGDNAFDAGGGVSIWRVLIRQVANALTLVYLTRSVDELRIGASIGNGFIVWNKRLY